MSKGILQVHPPICDCPGCRISSPVNRGRLADKRTVALPTARVLKKELTPSFSPSDGDSDGSGPACGLRPGLKQEDTPHVRIMKRRYFYWGPGWGGRTGSNQHIKTGVSGQLRAEPGHCEGPLPWGQGPSFACHVLVSAKAGTA
uniref:Sterile alpha motif domain containing 11 n=2 Tax=Ursus TaxID=9639 RepID=A0A452T6D1_URSMA